MSHRCAFAGVLPRIGAGQNGILWYTAVCPQKSGFCDHTLKCCDHKSEAVSGNPFFGPFGLIRAAQWWRGRDSKQARVLAAAAGVARLCGGGAAGGGGKTPPVAVGRPPATAESAGDGVGVPPPSKKGAHRSDGGCAKPDQPAPRVPLPYAMPNRGCALPAGGTAAGGGRVRSRCRLSSSRYNRVGPLPRR